MKNAPKDQIFRSGFPLIKCVKDQRKEEDDKCEEETATPRESLAVSSERSLPVTPFIRRPPATIALWVSYCIALYCAYCIVLSSPLLGAPASPMASLWHTSINSHTAHTTNSSSMIKHFIARNWEIYISTLKVGVVFDQPTNQPNRWTSWPSINFNFCDIVKLHLILSINTFKHDNSLWVHKELWPSFATFTMFRIVFWLVWLSCLIIYDFSAPHRLPPKRVTLTDPHVKDAARGGSVNEGRMVKTPTSSYSHTRDGCDHIFL